MFNISADCKEESINPDLKIVVTSQLPAKSGTTIEYHCSLKYVRKVGNVDAICNDGEISFPSYSGGATPCFKPGTESRMISINAFLNRK